MQIDHFFEKLDATAGEKIFEFDGCDKFTLFPPQGGDIQLRTFRPYHNDWSDWTPNLSPDDMPGFSESLEEAGSPYWTKFQLKLTAGTTIVVHLAGKGADGSGPTLTDQTP